MNFADVCAGDFFDEAFCDEELPDSFFYEGLDRYREDPIIFRSKKREIVNGIESSYAHKINYDKDVIEMGPKDVEKPRYVIDHDESVVDCVYEWYERYLKGANMMFPDVPISKPGIPRNCIEKDRIYKIELWMMNYGFSLVNPTYSQVDKLSCYGRFYSENPITEFERTVDQINWDDKLFFSFKSIPEDFMTYLCVGMQFNPFHPMSVSRIVNVVQKDMVFEGTYIMGGDEYPFSYDLRSTLYRIHSDVWVPTVQADTSGRYECFDLVGNYDFSVDLGVYDQVHQSRVHRLGTFLVPDYIIEPLFIEPYYTDAVPMFPYSAIGPWGGKYGLGQADRFYVPYVTRHLEQVDEYNVGRNWFDISYNVKEADEDGYLLEDQCDECILGNNCGKEHPDIWLSIVSNPEKFFFKRNYTRSRIVVYKQVFTKGASDHPRALKFLKFPGRVRSFPTNGKESIIYDIRMTTLLGIKAISLIRKDIHEFFSMTYHNESRNVGMTMELDDKYQESVDLLEEHLSRLQLVQVAKEMTYSNIEEMMSIVDKVISFSKQANLHGELIYDYKNRYVYINFVAQKGLVEEVIQHFEDWNDLTVPIVSGRGFVARQVV